MEAYYLLISSLLLAKGATKTNPDCFDHQNVNYHSQFQETECNEKCTVTPFFSPDHSVDTYLDLIQSAEKTIDLYTPGKSPRSSYVSLLRNYYANHFTKQDLTVGASAQTSVRSATLVWGVL